MPSPKKKVIQNFPKQQDIFHPIVWFSSTKKILSHLILLIIQQKLPLSATRVGLNVLFSISKVVRQCELWLADFLTVVSVVFHKLLVKFHNVPLKNNLQNVESVACGNKHIIQKYLLSYNFPQSYQAPYIMIISLNRLWKYFWKCHDDAWRSFFEMTSLSQFLCKYSSIYQITNISTSIKQHIIIFMQNRTESTSKFNKSLKILRSKNRQEAKYNLEQRLENYKWD
jgi:hypothetical protein